MSGGRSANLKISSVQQAAEIYAPNGENIAGYSSLGGGWTDIQTREEHPFSTEPTAVRFQVFREARAEMRAAASAPAASDSLTGVDIHA